MPINERSMDIISMELDEQALDITQGIMDKFYEGREVPPEIQSIIDGLKQSVGGLPDGKQE